MSKECSASDTHSLASDDIAEIEVEYTADADFLEDDNVPGKLWQDSPWRDHEILGLDVWFTIAGKAIRLPVDLARVKDEYMDLLYAALVAEAPEPSDLASV